MPVVAAMPTKSVSLYTESKHELYRRLEVQLGDVLIPLQLLVDDAGVEGVAVLHDHEETT